jgi:hypothetical protein
MKSIAIWYEPIDNNLESIDDIELHFNLWKIPNGTKNAHKFLDIGLKLANTENLNCLKIYFPTIITSIDFEDIVRKFIDKPDLVSAIFNENYNVKLNPTSKFNEVSDIDSNFIFNIYKSSTTDINFENNFEGTIVTINLPKQDQRIYLRYRIKGKFINSLSTISKPTNAILESAFSEIEMIDFRVNEIRDLNLSLLEGINKKLLKIEKLHFFFICSNDEEVVGNHQPFLSCRNLENYRWNNYVDLPNTDKQIYLAYHWKEKAKESVSILIKSKYERNNLKTIFKYAIFALVIAVVIELFSNWLYDVLKGILTYKCN